MLEDDEKKTDKTSHFTRAMKMEFKTDILHLQSSHSRKQSETYSCFSFFTITISIASYLNHSNFFNILSFCDLVEQTICESNHKAIITVNSLSTTIIPFFPKQPQNQHILVPDKKE